MPLTGKSGGEFFSPFRFFLLIPAERKRIIVAFTEKCRFLGTKEE